MPTLARKYAVVLGSLTMTVAVLRAVKDAQNPDAALWTALGLMLAFAAIGLVVGWLADAMVVESVKAQAEAQLREIASHKPQQAESSRVP